MTLSLFLALIRLTLRDPQAAAHRVIGLLGNRDARIFALGAVMALSAALGLASEMLFSFVTGTDLGPATAPVWMALIQGGLMLYTAAAMTVFGRQFGGTGRFGEALSLVLWIEAVMIAGQLVQLGVMLFFPLVAVLLTLALIGLMFWLLIAFTAALHGFDNLFWVGGGVLAVFFGSAMLIGSALLSLGITPPFMAES